MKNALILKILGGMAVMVAGFYFGSNYIGNLTKNQTAQSPTQGTDIPPATDQAPTSSATVRHASAEAGAYTAPGAPNISIDETQLSIAKPSPTPAAAKKDSEASETGLPVSTTTGSTAGTTDNSDPNAVTQPTPDSSDGSNPVATPVGDNSQPILTSTPLGSSVTDGSSVNPQPAGIPHQNQANSSTGLYHVQAGAFLNLKNATTLESALQSKGYAAMTVHQFQGGHDSYVVQVGAYSSSVTADQMVGNLQRDGFAASVSRGM
jgi:cell division septation protein DedD